ncbi:MAG: DUF1189 family protein [Victivallales bacterium]|nr:DUF1189 family protein [Victivallales bacterium]
MPESPKQPERFPLFPAPIMQRMPFRYVFLGLFLWPKLSLLTIRLQGGWFAPLALILACALGGSVVKASLTSPEFVDKFHQLTKVLSETLGTLQVKNDALQWSSEEKLPRTVNGDEWRVDILGPEDNADFGKIEQGVDTKGLVVSDKGLRFWFRSPDTGKLFPMKFDFPIPYVISFLNTYGTPRQNIPTMTPHELEKCPLRLHPFIFVCVACINFSLYLQPIFLCSFIFVVLTLVFRRERWLPFGNLLASALCSCTPPFLLALIYDQFPLWQIEYHSLFVAIFFIYLIIILIDKSVIIRKDNPNRPPDDTDF